MTRAALRPLVVVPSVAVLALGGLIATPTAALAAPADDIRITEWMYNNSPGDGKEFVELTNLGSDAVDMTGWSFDDDSEVPGTVSLSGFGTVLPGESVIFTDNTVAGFRAEWGVPDTVKIVGENSAGLGNGDEINVFDGSGELVDHLAYPGDKRTDGVSAWIPEGSLGTNDAASAVSSAIGDQEGSWAAADGAIGSPGLSSLGSGFRWVRINEVDSDTDTVELVNLASLAIDVSDWRQTDSGHSPAALEELSVGVVPAHGYATFTSNQGLSADGDAVRLYLPTGADPIDTVAYGAGQAEPGSWSRCPDGTGADFVHAATATFGAANDCDGGEVDPGDDGDTPPTDPNWADIVINEISSDNDGFGFAPLPTLSDAIELYNTGDEAVSVEGWKQIDSGAASAAAVFSDGLYVDGALATVIPAGGFGVFQSTKGLGSGGDAVKVYTPDGTLVDEVTYLAGQAGVDETVNTDHTYTALARCSDGEDTFLEVETSSFGASNAAACATGVPPLTGGSGPEAACDTEDSGTAPGTIPAGALAWPGSATPVTIDAVCAWVTTESGQDLSGLAFDPNDAGVLYAVKNKSHVWRLLASDGGWTPDTANGWAEGKDIRFPGGTGLPDSEGIAVGPDGSLYITTERDNAASGVPLDSILRFDPTAAGTTLSATDQWTLTDDLGFAPTDSADANLGFEGVAYVPDAFLVEAGFRTDAGELYDPADYDGKVGDGLFFGAVEKTGHLRAYALGADHGYERVADVDSGLVGVMDASFDADLGGIWAHCDNTCGNATSLLTIGTDGRFAVDRTYLSPAGLPNYNLEGFAVAPASTAVDGQRQVLWADDGNRFGHSLWAGTLPVDLGVPADDAVTLTTTATAVRAGDSIPITATGLTPGAEYIVTLHSDPVEVGRGAAGPDGVLSLTVVIPASTPAGAHSLTIAAAADPDVVLATLPLAVGAAGSLISTGSEPQAWILGGLALLLAGAVLIVVRRLGRHPVA